MNLQPRHPLLSASLLSLALALSPLQAQAAPRPAAPAAAGSTATATAAPGLDILSVWLDAVRMQLIRWLPDGSGPAPGRKAGAAGAARPGAARLPAVSIQPPRSAHRPDGWWRLDCGPQVDPNGNCG